MIRPTVLIGFCSFPQLQLVVANTKPLASIRVSNIISNRFYAVLLHQPKLTPQTLDPIEEVLALLVAQQLVGEPSLGLSKGAPPGLCGDSPVHPEGLAAILAGKGDLWRV